MLKLSLGLNLRSLSAAKRYLASILYQTSLGDFVYTTDGSGNVILDNQGSLGATNDGLIYSGRGLELLATNNLSIPIHHTLGAEKVVNGTFDTDTNWTKGIGWTISAGVASSDGSQTTFSYLDSILYAPVGGYYLVTFEVTSYTAGGVFCAMQGINGTTRTAIGVYSQVIYPTGSSFPFQIVANADFIGSIDNVSVKQITNPNSYLTYYDFSKSGFVTLGNSVDGGSSANLEKVVNGGFDTDTVWVKTGGWGISVGKASVINAAIESFLYQPILVQGISYRVIFDVDSFSGTFTVIDNIGTVLHTVTSTGNNTFSFTYKGTNSNLLFRIAAGSSASIDNVSVRQILPISTTYTLNTKTANNFLTHTTNWSASDWTKINNNPNLVGKLALETTGATKTIPELDMVMDAGASADKWYPCSEKSGGYVVDARASLGSELLTNTAVSVTNGDEITTYTKIDINSYNLAVTTVGTATNRPILPQTVGSKTLGKIYRWSFNATVNSGTAIISSLFDGSIITLNHQIINGENVILFKATATGTSFQFYFDGTKLFNINVTNSSVKQASAQEISNYAATVRTNADFQQKGLQTTAFVQDGAGVPTAYSSNLLQFNGDGRYVDTGWIPDGTKSFTIMWVSTKDSTSTQALQQFGEYIAGSACMVSEPGNGNTTTVVFIGNATVTITTPNGLYFGIAYWDAATSSVGFSINGGAYTIQTAKTFGASAVSFLLGKTTAFTGRNMLNPTGNFKVNIGKVFTQAEVATAYAQAKLIYPSLQ